jgi:hypothetical protein
MVFFSLCYLSVFNSYLEIGLREREFDELFLRVFSLSLLIEKLFLFTFLAHEIPLSEKLFGLVCFCWKRDVQKSAIFIHSLYAKIV